MSDDHTHPPSGSPRPPSDAQPLPPDAELTVGAARLGVTHDRAAAPPAQSARLQGSVHQEPMPKTGMQIPSPAHHEMFDVTIIGAGPTGLFAAFYAGMREMSVKVIDSLGDLGGQVSALYPEKYIYDVGGFPQVRGKELVTACVQQAMQFGPSVCLGERVESLERQPDDTFILNTDKGHHHSRTVIISAGIGAFAPRKLANLPELDALEGKSVFYFVRDPDEFRDKHLLIVGGGDSAMDWALNLEPVTKSTTLIHRRDRWRAHEDTVQRVLRSKANVKTFHEVRDVKRDNGTLKGVTIYDNRTQAEVTLPVDRIILSLGFIANLGPIKDWGLTIVDGGIAVDTTMATNLAGVFAAGDVARFPGKLNLIATGFGEAATAANFAKAYIDPTSRAFPGHSSEKSDPHP